MKNVQQQVLEQVNRFLFQRHTRANVALWINYCLSQRCSVLLSVTQHFSALLKSCSALLSITQHCSNLAQCCSALLSVAQHCSVLLSVTQHYSALLSILLSIAQNCSSKIKLDNLGQYSLECEWTVKASAKENELSFKNIQLVSTSVLKQQLNKAFCVFFVREFMLALLESFSKKNAFTVSCCCKIVFVYLKKYILLKVDGLFAREIENSTLY